MGNGKVRKSGKGEVPLQKVHTSLQNTRKYQKMQTEDGRVLSFLHLKRRASSIPIPIFHSPI